MIIRSIAVVGLLVFGSGAFALAQGGRVPGVPVDALQQQPKTILMTPFVFGGKFTCSLLNVSKSPLSLPKNAIKIFVANGEAFPGGEDSCPASLPPGMGCTTTADLDDSFVYDAYCRISFVGGNDRVRGALQAWSRGHGVNSYAVEAR
jgi:hypothetical protein